MRKALPQQPTTNSHEQTPTNLQPNPQPTRPRSPAYYQRWLPVLVPTVLTATSGTGTAPSGEGIVSSGLPYLLRRSMWDILSVAEGP